MIAQTFLYCMTSAKSSLDDELEMQQFLQSAVHDLRAAQRRTGIAAELMLQTDAKEERAELAGQLLQGLSRTEELLTGIGRFATAFTPSRYSMATFSCSSAVRFALANLDKEIRETSATVVFEGLPEIVGDRDRLSEVFEHLIGNSLKFRGPDPPAIEVTAYQVPEGWLFSVRDNGLGIPSKYRDRLFIGFRRLQGADIPGSGLGLAISRKIVEGHGGRIWIGENDAPGVTILFSLPITDGA